MTTLETIRGLGAATVEDVDQRVAKLEKLHYVWAPVIIAGLVAGYFVWRGRR